MKNKTLQVAEFLDDTTTVAAEARELATVCSTTEDGGSAVQPRAHLLHLPPHHRHAVFTHLLTLVPLNTLLTSHEDLLQPIAAALLRDSRAHAQPGGDRRAGTTPRLAHARSTALQR
jgi:hypothetical protein